MSEASDHTHIATNGRVEYTFEDLANLQGGLANIMVDISQRATRCWQAAQAKNRLVARHQLGELAKSLRLAAIMRPQYREALERFIEQDLGKVRSCIDASDWDNFEGVWEGLTIAVNANHEQFDHGYLVWKVPTDAPSDLDLTPRD